MLNFRYFVDKASGNQSEQTLYMNKVERQTSCWAVNI